MDYKIEVLDNRNNAILNYESSIIPQAGDTYAAINFEDQHQRTVIGRLLVPNCKNSILVKTTYSFPELVALEKSRLGSSETVLS